MDISGLFAGAFTVLKRRLGLFLLISMFPAVLTMVVIVAVIALVGVGAAAIVQGWNGSALGIALGIAAVLLIAIGLPLVQMKAYSMMVLASYEIAQGQQPDFRGVLARTKGFLPRFAPLLAIIIVVIAAIYAVLGWIIFGVFSGIRIGSDSGNVAAAVAGILAIFFFGFVILVPLSIYLSTKLLYVLPAMTIEQAGGIESLGRSWRLTKGAFWRTLGYYLLAALAVSALSFLASMITQIFTMPLSAGMSRTTSSAEAIDALTAMIPVIAASSILQIAVQLFAAPFLYAYLTFMFIDQVRRSEMPSMPYAAPGSMPGAGYAPGYYQPPAPPQPTTGWQAPTSPPQPPFPSQPPVPPQG